MMALLHMPTFINHKGISNMYVVIFRSKIRSLDDEYTKVAARMRELALDQFGCIEFHALTEGNEEVALSYWHDEDSIREWKTHSEHVLAQQLGKQRWYESYIVQVAQITREYRVATV
ncbi:MAG: antibiotic biosynthesis monooxygenase family protein [Burkholderiaceae bacterium]